MKPFETINAETIDEAASILNENGTKARLMAGGTDLITGLKKKIYGTPPEILVNIQAIPDMEYIREEAGKLKIGARTTLDEIANSDLVKSRHPALAEAAEKTASPLIRYTGTIAGNICQDPRCWYYRSDHNYFNCLMKGGDTCYAMKGDNRYHSIMGSVKMGQTACSKGCPTDVDIAAYMSQIRVGRMDEAAEILMETNPIPAVTGRVCPHFCQEGCNRKGFDESVSIRSAERYLGDHILENPERFMKVDATDTGRKMAIVGSGPAGLTAAYYLRKAGHQVTVYDKLEKAGGMLTYAIPNYRLPAGIVEKQVKAIEGMGVAFQLGVEIGSDVSVDQLSKENDAVFVATGAWTEREMGLEGEDLAVSGLEFLNRVHGSTSAGDSAAGKVLVVGGGNVAVDVATTLKRMGADPCIVYRRTRDEMPAIKAEVDGAIEEGVQIDYLTLPVKVEKMGNKLAVHCVKMERGEPDDSGRASVTPIEGSEFMIEADAIMKAIGESSDLSILPDSLVEAAKEIQWKERSSLLGDNIYTGGDFLTGPSTVTQAISAGRLFAENILGQSDVSKPVPMLIPIVPKSEDDSVMSRESGRSLSEKQSAPMDPDSVTLPLEQIKQEAHRCMNCGCITSSPSDLAPVLLASDATIITTSRRLKSADFCKVGSGKLHSLRPGEIITEIELPDPGAGRQAFLKFRIRGSIDFPIVSAAAAVNSVNGTVQDLRLVLGAVAPVPVRVEKAEAVLKNSEITEESAEAAAEAAVADAVALKRNRYKIEIAKVLMKRVILACAD